MEHDCSIGGATHAGIGDAYHVFDACLKDPGRQGHVPHLRHSRIAAWSTVLEHHDTSRINLEPRIINPGVEILNILKYDCPPAMLHEFRGGRRRLDYSTIRTQIAVQHSDPAAWFQGLSQRLDDV